MKEGTIVSVEGTVATVIFDSGDTAHIHHTLLAEKLDGLVDDDRQLLTE